MVIPKNSSAVGGCMVLNIDSSSPATPDSAKKMILSMVSTTKEQEWTISAIRIFEFKRVERLTGRVKVRYPSSEKKFR